MLNLAIIDGALLYRREPRSAIVLEMSRPQITAYRILIETLHELHRPLYLFSISENHSVDDSVIDVYEVWRGEMTLLSTIRQLAIPTWSVP